jgi:hypothetical protein
MSKFIGRQLAIGIGKEAVRGVGVAPTYWLHATSFKYNDKVSKVKEDGFTGGIWNGDQSFVTQKWADGDIECDMTDKSFGLILLSAFGAVSDASYLSVYKHTYTLSNSAQHQSLSMHTKDPIGQIIFELTMLDKLEIKIVPQEIVKTNLTFKSKNGLDSVSTASLIAENKFLGRHLDFRLASTTSGLAGASKISSVKSLTLTIEKNTEIYDVIGTVQPNDIINKNIMISGEIELSYEDNTWKNYMLDGTYKAMRIALINTQVTIGSTNPAFLIDLSKVEFDAWEVDYPLNDLVNQKIKFACLYDLGGNNNLFNDCYLVNEVASY